MPCPDCNPFVGTDEPLEDATGSRLNAVVAQFQFLKVDGTPAEVFRVSRPRIKLTTIGDPLDGPPPTAQPAPCGYA